MLVAIASDHAGFAYKERIKAWLAAHGHEVNDFGAFSNEPSDYPLFVRPAAEAVADGRCERGIVLGGSGNGEAMVANRVKGVRCALCWSEDTAVLARRHNNANMISIGERMIPFDVVEAVLHRFFTEPFDGGRHERRIAQIDGQ